MEAEIALDTTDKRAEKVKERQEHYLAQKIDKDKQDERTIDPQEKDIPNDEPRDSDVPMSDANEQGQEGEEPLIDGPVTASDRRIQTPERKKAVKRSVGIHDEEPDTKKIIIEDDEMDEADENDGIDVDSIAAKKQDQDILYHAMLGQDLMEIYSNRKIKLAADRHMVSALLSTDISEMSPEIVTCQ